MSKAIRLSCWSAVVGAAITIIAVLILALTISGFELDVKTAQSAAFLVGNLAGFVGGVLLVYGLPGVYARWREGWGRMGLAGIALIALAVMIIAFASMLSAIVDPWLADKAPDLLKDPGPPLFFAILIVWMLATIGGTILMAVPILRRRVGPRSVGFLLIASAVMYPIYIWAASSRPNVLVSLVGSLSPILFLVAFGYLGYLGASETRTARAESMPSAAHRA